MKAFIIDINKCNGCHNCQLACKDEHVGNEWLPYAKPQSDTGQFWTKVIDVVQGSCPKVRVRYMHEMCQHCEEAPCISSCSSKAIYRRNDGIVIIDPVKCTGARHCISACPYGVIYFNYDLNIAQKCTMCAHLLDKGWKEPRCVDACPTDALKFGDEKDLKDLISKAEELHPEYKAKPRVYYIGLPNKIFIAGAVYDAAADRCIKDASATVTGIVSGEKFTALTDNYGDFWIEKLKPGKYSLTVEKAGYQSYKVEQIDAEKDVNLGDIALRKQ